MLQIGILAVEGSISLRIGIDDNVLLRHLIAERRQVAKTALMDQQTVERVADADAARLGVVDDSLAHLQVAVFVEVGIHNAGTGLDDRDAGGVAHEVDKFTSTTWNAKVDVADGVQHLARRLVGSRQQGDHVSRHAVARQHLMNQCHLLAVRAVGILTTFQHTGVTALEAEREDVERHVRACLVNHADDTERNAYPAQSQTVRQRLLFRDVP